MDPRPTPVIVDPHGQPARAAVRADCPRCGATPERRVVSAGFGVPHDVCGVCGHDFPECTV